MRMLKMKCWQKELTVASTAWILICLAAVYILGIEWEFVALVAVVIYPLVLFRINWHG